MFVKAHIIYCQIKEPIIKSVLVLMLSRGRVTRDGGHAAGEVGGAGGGAAVVEGDVHGRYREAYR